MKKNKAIQIKSKQRVSEFGEVFTAEREVKAMCDLVQTEINKLESKILEPACGDGNFLAEIYSRKLEILKNQSQNLQDFEKNSYLLCGSIYGIEILQDNTEICRERLFNLWNNVYTEIFQENTDDKFRQKIKAIISKNIICGNTLSCMEVDENHKENERFITFTDWNSQKEYKFKELLENPSVEKNEIQQLELFESEKSFHFDVIIGNPPYQQADGGNENSAMPIYHHFINQAKILNPHYITMIIPSRWFSGGKGLSNFRKQMLEDKHISHLVDYENMRDAFPKVDLAGGACYFLWDKNYNGECLVRNFNKNQFTEMYRKLDEFEVFIRQNKAVEIIHKILKITENSKMLTERVSNRVPFGIETKYEPKTQGIPCYFTQKIGMKFVNSEDVTDSYNCLEQWKFIASRAPISGHTNLTRPVGFYLETNTRILKPGECCTDSCIVLGSFDTKEEAEYYKSYIFTKLVRFLILQTVVSQDVVRKNYRFVPDLGQYTQFYTDEFLCQLWNISKDEWEYIDSKVK